MNNQWRWKHSFHFVQRSIPIQPMMLPESINFMSLPDLVLLDILSYLSCEDALYTMGSLHSDRLDHLLVERGAFRQICLSPTLLARQYDWLLDGVWSLQSVESLVLHGVFAEFFISLSQLQKPLPSLTDLHLIDVDDPHRSIEQFIQAHSFTLTHLTITSNFQSFTPSPISGLLTNILPQLRRLIRLDTGSNNNIYVSIDNSSKIFPIITSDLHSPDSNSNDQIHEICNTRRALSILDQTLFGNVLSFGFGKSIEQDNSVSMSEIVDSYSFGIFALMPNASSISRISTKSAPKSKSILSAETPVKYLSREYIRTSDLFQLAIK
jgi:hypothetical protein